jgi:hypothetical protein
VKKILALFILIPLSSFAAEIRSSDNRASITAGSADYRAGQLGGRFGLDSVWRLGGGLGVSKNGSEGNSSDITAQKTKT